SLRFVEVAFEGVERAAPQPPVRGEPSLELGKSLGAQRVQATPPVGPSLHQARLAQDPQMARRVRLAQSGLRDQLADRPRAFDQKIEDLPAGGLCDDFE